MLHFACRPDPVLTEILHEAMGDMHERLAHPSTDPSDAERRWKTMYPRASVCFSLPLAVYTLDRLLAASKIPTTVYGVTDYHWLLLYDCLHTFCTVHNDYVHDSPEQDFPFGPYTIGEIHFGKIADHYFWDTDFLMEAATVNRFGPKGREMLGVSDEAFGIAQKLTPHVHELKFEVVDVPRWDEEPLMEGPYGPRIPAYPGEYEPPEL